MKTAGAFVRTMLLLLLNFIISNSLQAFADPLTGVWEGNFMGDFRTVLEISSPSPGNYSGTIRMFNGPQMIQNDALSEIQGSGPELVFLIPAKETSFKGIIHEDSMTLSGQFIFPDGSEHPIELTRQLVGADNESESEDAGNANYEAYRQQQFTTEQMKEDLLFLMKSLQQNHPRLYSYTDEKTMAQLVGRIMESFREPLSTEAFLRRLAPVVDAVHCSHTGIRLPAEYGQLTEQYGKFLPLQVLCRPEGTYLVGTPGKTGYEIPAGARILSINGVPSEKIIKALLPLIPAEGTNMTAKWYQLSRQFAWYYHLLDPSEQFRVEFLKPSSHETISFSACSLDEVEPERLASPEAVPLAFSFSESGKTGILKVPTFSIMDMEGYMAELDQIFRQLNDRKAGHLILDLRGNDGGHPIFAAQLLSYLVRDDFTYFKKNPDVSEFEPLYHPMSPNPAAFTGNVYVLTDGGCLSTTGHLLSLLQCHTQAVFVGEEPGSTFRCNDFSTQVRLPNSGIEANIPRVTFETAVAGLPSAPGEETFLGIDHPVSACPEDIAAGIDRTMLACMGLIRES